MNLKYCICTSPRSGSTLLTDLLGKTQLVGIPNEFIPHYQSFKECGVSNSEFGDIWGFSLMFKWFEELPIDVDLKSLKIIHLRRHNKVLQAISMLKALKTDQWHIKEDEEPHHRDVEIEYSEISAEIARLIVQDILWVEYFEEKEIVPLNIFYEDFQYEKDHVKIVNQVLSFLEVKVSVDEVNSVFQVQRDADSYKRYYNYLDLELSKIKRN